MAALPVPESVALPPSEFHSIGRGIKEKLEALKASKLAAKQQRAASAADQLQSFVLSLDSGSSNSAAAAAASTPATPAAAASASAAATPAALRSSPLGFAGGDDFISLKLGGEDEEEEDAAAADATPARGTKRKFGDDASTPASSPPPVQAEGAYKAPWATCTYSHPNFTVRLHEELLDFCTYVSPKSEEQIMREELVQRLQALVREAFPSSPNVHLKPFGSYATKLYLPISDIDLVLFGVDDDRRFPPGEKGKNSPLGVLERTMRSKQNATYLEHISGARIPILKLTDKATGVKIDICYNIEGGLRAAEFIVGMQKQMPALRPLTLFLKYFLHCRILNDTYKGGIGSFMLQLMLINHLQSLQLDGRLSHPNTNLGMLLMSFLESYGISLNYKHTGLNMNAALNPDASAVSRNSSLEVPASSSSAARVGFFNKFNRGWYNANRPYLLSIENPLDPNHDVGSNSYLIMRVRKALQFAYNVLAAHVFHESERVARGEPFLRKKQRFDLSRSSDPARPFARPSHTPHTLLSHIISVNDEIRADQVLVEYEEMAEMVEQQEQAEAFKRKHMHKIVSSSDDEEEEEEGELGRASATSSLEEGEVKPASASSAAAAVASAAAAVVVPAAASASNFVDMDVHPDLQIPDSSSSSEDSYTSASESDADADDGPSAALSKFEARQVDRDGGDEEMGEESGSDGSDSSAESEESDAEDDDDGGDDDDDGDESGALDSDLDSTDLHRLASSADPGLYASGSVDLDELNRYSNRKSRKAGGAHKLLGKINAPPGDFISLNGYSAPPSSRSHGGSGDQRGGKGGSRKKGKGYQFDNASGGGGGGGAGAGAVRKHKSSKKKQSKQQQGVRTGGTKPNNAIFESKRSKERKSTKKKKDKQARKKQRT